MRVVTKTNFGKSYGPRTDVVAFGCVDKACPVKPQIDANNENITDKVELFNRRQPCQK